MKAKILISILAIALVAGCVVPGLEIPGAPAIGAGIGLEIISFTAEPSTVFSRSGIRVTVEVENRGGTTVKNDSALVYLTGSNIDLDQTNGDYWYGREAGDDRSEIRRFSKDELRPENVVRGTPADKERFSWSLIAPNVTPGQTRQDTFIVRVYNEYSSGVNGNIWVYTDSEAEATRAAGRAMKTSSFTTVSGPVAVNVRVSPDPVILYEDENQFTFNIEITNTAKGTIYKNNSIPYSTATVSDLSLSAEDELNWVTVDVDTDLSITECTGEQEIFGGKSMTLVCEATIPTGYEVTTFRSYRVDVIVKYGYYTQREAIVTVQGR